MLIATLMSLAVLSIFVNQTTTLSRTSQLDNASQEANRTFNLISRLLRQAQQNSINIQYPTTANPNNETTAELEDDSININFSLPFGFNIWPNDKAPYDKNDVRITWNNNVNGDKPYVIQIANAANAAGINLTDFAGDNSGDQARIVNLDLWPLSDQRNLHNNLTAPTSDGYLLRVTARTAKQDSSYTNPNVDENDPMKHYRTYTVAGIVSPRN